MWVVSQYKVRELASEKVIVHLVVVQEKTNPLLSSEANAGVGSRTSESCQYKTHFNGCAGLHHPRNFLQEKIPLLSKILRKNGWAMSNEIDPHQTLTLTLSSGIP